VGGKADWQHLHGIDKRQLSEARLQAHYAVQWLARIARAYIPPQPDDGHTNLIWDRKLDSLMTQPLKDQLYFSVSFAGPLLIFHSRELPPQQIICFAGQSDLEVRHSLDKILAAHGLYPSALDRPPAYEIPPHPLANGGKYNADHSLNDAFAELSAWFANADLLLNRLRDRFLTLASPVRCWPHHFDIATLTTIKSQNRSVTGYINAGLSPGDVYYDEPYFYVSVYPKPEPALLTDPLGAGHWHIQEFTAAVLPAHEVLKGKGQEEVAIEFLVAAVNGTFKILSKVLDKTADHS
jgi:hypothetical protein